MKKTPRKKTTKAAASQKKALKSPLKAIRKIIKKITRRPKKKVVRPKISVTRPAEKLILKKNINIVPMSSIAAGSPEPEPDRRLPVYYEEDKLVLLIRDPWWIYAYWEVTPGREAQIADTISRAGLRKEKTVLRVYDVTGASIEAPLNFFDIEIHHLNSNWYVDVGEAGREWIAEIGVKTRDGRFFALVRSNLVKTPSFGISEVTDEEWMMPDEMYFKLVGMITGFDATGGSMEMKKLFEKYIRQTVSSEAPPRLSRPAQASPNS